MTTEPVASAPKRGVKWIFIGDKGLRAGWGALLFVAIIVALIVVLNLVLHAINFHSPKTPGMPKGLDPMSTIFQEGLLAAFVLIATLITAAIERRPLSQLGFSLSNAVPRFLQGLVIGFVMLSALVGALYLCHAFVIDKIALHGAEAFKYGWQWFAAFLLVGIFEELCFRGYLQQTIARGLNFRWASLILGVLFLGAHTGNGGETAIGLAMVLAAALVFSYSVWRTGTVWWGIGFHAAWDWAQSYFYGVADSGQVSAGALMVSHPVGPAWLSGGSTGPEGSILALATMLLTAGVIWLTLRKQDQTLDIKW